MATAPSARLCSVSRLASARAAPAARSAPRGAAAPGIARRAGLPLRRVAVRAAAPGDNGGKKEDGELRHDMDMAGAVRARGPVAGRGRGTPLRSMKSLHPPASPRCHQRSQGEREGSTIPPTNDALKNMTRHGDHPCPGSPCPDEGRGGPPWRSACPAPPACPLRRRRCVTPPYPLLPPSPPGPPVGRPLFPGTL